MSNKTPIRVPNSTPASAFLSRRAEPPDEIAPAGTMPHVSREQEAPQTPSEQKGKALRTRPRPKWQGRTLYLTDAAAELIENERLRRLKTPAGRADRSVAEYSVIVCDAVVAFLGSTGRV